MRLAGIIFATLLTLCIAPAVSALETVSHTIQSDSQEFNFLAVQQDALYYAPVSTQFAVWVLLLIFTFAFLILSVVVPWSEEFTAFTALILCGFCAYAIPSLDMVTYVSEISVIENTTMQIITPVITHMGSIPLMFMMIGLFIICILNCWRAVMLFIERKISPTKDERESFRDEEFEEGLRNTKFEDR